ncbi:MAG: 2-phospho-L-lactate transferase [Gammaproteobacteria bacterium]|nr:2-phospho-L-lactate transferase [Gammaproteobacteria bacterium]MCH1551624.1 2-phospho-L-lactate transferase [Pseudomonadales bacterium]
MPKILAITGGVGGAKLALGLSKCLPAQDLLFAVNTGDDFNHLDLHIAPDIDSLTYALAEQNNTELGWGRADESWQFIETMSSLGGQSWFRLGDKDLALHMRRTGLLKQGASLTEATAIITKAMGIKHVIAPMSDEPVRTLVHSDRGTLAFQHYFVRERCEPRVTGFDFDGISKATINPLIQSFLPICDGVIICPSNPFVSVDPVLTLPGMREALTRIPVIAVSPIVAGLAIKGPAAKMMAELKIPATASAVAAHYGDLLSGFVLDQRDADQQSAITPKSYVTDTIMDSVKKRIQLAQGCLKFLAELA